MVSVEDPDVYCFLWITRDEKIEHIQFVYDETVIEWFEKKGIIVGQTNRLLHGAEGKTGRQKGVRTIHDIVDEDAFSEGLEFIHNSIFPKAYQQIIQQKMRIA